MTVALFRPVWACGAGIFSLDPVTMETEYMGHGEVFCFNSCDLGESLVVLFNDVENALCVIKT